MIKKIKELSNIRNLAKWNIEGYEWNASNERELICLIKEAERQDIRPVNHKDWTHMLSRGSNYSFIIQKNDTPNGCTPNYHAPCATGATPLQAMRNAWKMWSIPPILIMNSEWFVKGISITDVL